MTLDAHSRTLLESLAQQGVKPFHQMEVAQARGVMTSLRDAIGSGPDMLRVEDVLIDAGNNAFRLRALVPAEQCSGVIVYCHGGGWALMSVDDYDALGRYLAHDTGCAVILVEYRLAPEHPYPAAVDDVWQALEWADRNRKNLSGSVDAPLIIAGDSAGGNLAAVTAQRAHSRGAPILTQQLLIYPVMQDDLNRPCYLDPDNQGLLGQADMRWFWDLYLPDVEARHLPGASPLRAKSLQGLPPAVLLTAEHDVLRDEGEEYVAALRSAGVPVEHRRFAGQMHGFFSLGSLLPASAEARAYLAATVCARLRKLRDDVSTGERLV